MSNNPNTKAIVLFSGGLDSMLAAKLLMEQGVEVAGVCFTSDFFGAAKAEKAAATLGIGLKIVDIGEEELALVKNPPSGYGKHLNPCIDCHALMVKKAGEMARAEKFDIIATGEVLGQRPFSQTKDALARVTKLAGTEILRPLSAKLLPETTYERDGLVVRGKLLGIKGRGRERQMELAEKYGLTGYATPAGGCLLTDPEFSNRLLKMLEFRPDCGRHDIGILKYGRVFWLKESGKKKISNVLLIVGRDEQDNTNLEKLALAGDIVVELKEEMGPTSLIRGLEAEDVKSILEMDIPEKLALGKLQLDKAKTAAEIIEISSLITGYYAVKARGRTVKISMESKS